jgi:hypothetical protein
LYCKFFTTQHNIKDFDRTISISNNSSNKDNFFKMSPTIVLSKCNDPNWERVDPEDRNVKSSSFMYFENGLEGVNKARQDAEALITGNPKISSLLRDVILASTFATIDRKEKYFLEIEAKKKKKRDRIIDNNDVEHGHDLLMPKRKKIKVEETQQEPIPIAIVPINVAPCIITATKLIFPSSPSIVGATRRRRRPSEKRKMSHDNDQDGIPAEGAIVTATRLIFPSIPATSPSSSSSSSSVPSKKKRRKIYVVIPTNNDESATAIVKFQKATRGFLARKLNVDRRITAVAGYGVVRIQKLARGFLIRSHLAAAEVQQKKVAATSTVRIQKHVRGFLARKRLQIELLPAAASTQATTTTTTASCHSNSNCKNDICCICLEVPDQNAAKIDCGCDHRFCFECIQKWGTEKSNTCPYCRGKFHEITTTCMNNNETKTTQVKDHNSRSVGIESPQIGSGWYALDISAAEDTLVYDMEEAHRDGRDFSIQQYIEHIRANQEDGSYGPLETDQDAQIYEVMIRTAHEMPNYPQYIALFPPSMHTSATVTWHEILYAQTNQAQHEIMEAQRQGPVQVEQCLQKYRRLSRLS